MSDKAEQKALHERIDDMLERLHQYELEHRIGGVPEWAPWVRDAVELIKEVYMYTVF